MPLKNAYWDLFYIIHFSTTVICKPFLETNLIIQSGEWFPQWSSKEVVNSVDFNKKFYHFIKITTLYRKWMEIFLSDSEEGICTQKL